MKEDSFKRKKKVAKKSKLGTITQNVEVKPHQSVQKSELSFKGKTAKTKVKKSKSKVHPSKVNTTIKTNENLTGMEGTGKKKRRRKKKKKPNSKRNKYLHLVKQKQAAEVSSSNDSSIKRTDTLKSAVVETHLKPDIESEDIETSDHSQNKNVASFNNSVSSNDDEVKARVLKRKVECTDPESVSPKKKKKSLFDPKEIKERSQTLQNRMTDALKASQFRFFNEKLYKCTGSKAFKMFHEDPSSFLFYHEGYKTQVEKWPINPLDVIIKGIKKQSSDLIIADFGCGDARLARSIPNKVHSFDLYAINDLVTACDMAQVPLNSGSVDIAVFCLSLMGTNLLDYFQEAHRVLKKGGIMKIAEVESRFRNVEGFIHVLEKLGFTLKKKNFKHKMFVMFDMMKTGHFHRDKVPYLKLDPCLYKKR